MDTAGNNRLIFVSSVLSADSVSSLIKERYDIGSVNSCELIYSNINDTFKVETTGGCYACKIYGRFFTGYNVSDKIADCQKTELMGIKLVSNIKTTGGTTFTYVDCPEGKRAVELTKWAQGKVFTYHKLDEGRIYGRALAQLHNITGEENSLFRRKLDLTALFAEIRSVVLDFVQKDSRLYAALKPVCEEISKQVEALEISDCRTCFCHGDAHGGNAAFEGQEVVFFDWDYSGFGFAVYDLAAFLWMCLQRKNKTLWDRFVSGYQEICPISEEEKYFCRYLSIYRELWIMYLYILNKDKTGTAILDSFFLKKRLGFIQKIFMLKEI